MTLEIDHSVSILRTSLGSMLVETIVSIVVMALVAGFIVVISLAEASHGLAK